MRDIVPGAVAAGGPRRRTRSNLVRLSAGAYRDAGKATAPRSPSAKTIKPPVDVGPRAGAAWYAPPHRLPSSSLQLLLPSDLRGRAASARPGPLAARLAREKHRAVPGDWYIVACPRAARPFDEAEQAEEYPSRCRAEGEGGGLVSRNGSGGGAEGRRRMDRETWTDD